jgi:polyferredoxin
MGFRFLKWARVVVSLIFFLLIGFLFIDFGNTFSADLMNGILFFQFIPSMLKFINIVAIAVAGFIIVMILTVLFGRVYCSYLCPLGTLQDLIRVVSNRFKKRKRFRYRPPKNLLRYGFLGLTLLFLFFGSLIFINLLDPYSLFGKIISNLARPLYYTINNTGVWILEQFEVYTLFKVELKAYSWVSFGYSTAMLGLISWLVYKYGRLYCNTICPVGTFLGIVSRISVFKIRLDESMCDSCGICGSNCKAQCIDTQNKSVDFSRCVGCMNCLTACPSSGVKFSFSKKSSPVTVPFEPVKTRRNFIKNSALITGGVLSITGEAFSEGLNNGKIPVKREYTVTPPGSLSIRHFTQTCTACHLCVSACPTHVIQPSLFQYGIAGILQPFMDFNAHFCNFECTLCSEVCPTGAILPIELEEKKLTQLGISKFIKENCVVYTDEKDCGACSEHCPTKAVNMVFYKDRLKIPEVTKEICIGCGACEYACPTTPKSIYVDGNPIHKLAEKPKVEKIETEVNPEDDFPF